MSRSIDSLVPAFQATAAGFVREATAKVNCMLFDAGRTTLEQMAMYAQGREPLDEVNKKRVLAGMSPIVEYVGRDGRLHSDNEYTITECDGVRHKSAHQSLEAIDMVVLVSKKDKNGIVVTDRDGKQVLVPTWDYVTYVREYKTLRDLGHAHGLDCGADWMTRSDGLPSPYAHVGLGWDPPHFQRRH